MTLEILNRAFVFLRRCPAVKRAEIFPPACSRIFLAGIQPILAGFQFSIHECCSARCTQAIIMLVAPSNIRSSVESRARKKHGATAAAAESRLAGRAPLYKGFLKRFEMPSARSEARIARLVAR